MNMSETEALLALYGAIDQAVVAGQAQSSSLAPLLGAYRNGAAIGWYEGQYLPWLRGARERARHRDEERHRDESRGRDVVETEYEADLPAPQAPPLAAEAPPAKEAPPLSAPAQQVHDALISLPQIPADSRAAARRLLAVTAAVRALPQHFAPGGTHAEATAAALTFTHPDWSPGSNRPRAQQLHERLAADFTSMPDWSTVVHRAVDLDLLPETFRSQAVAPPCTGRLIMRPDADGTDPDPCLVLEAGFTTDALTFAEAKCWLEPANWEYPGSLWCRMEKAELIEENSWRYHETVATSCPASTAMWTVSTDLQFWFSHPTSNEARVEYDFPAGLPTALSDIEIDEGSLRMIELPDGRVQVKTTKRVRFAGAFDGAGLAMFMCAIGYGSALEDIVFAVTKSPNPLPFPVEFSQGGAMSPQPKVQKVVTGSTEEPETLDDLVTETTEFVAAFVKDCAETAKTSLQLVQSGNYKVENVWADGIKLWSTSMTGLAKALDLGVRTAKSFAESSAQAGGSSTTDET